jgi:hypothetical protein
MDLFRSTVKLTVKLKDGDVREVEEGVLAQEKLQAMTPLETSFWITSLFNGNGYQQQMLLEEAKTVERLR